MSAIRIQFRVIYLPSNSIVEKIDHIFSNLECALDCITKWNTDNNPPQWHYAPTNYEFIETPTRSYTLLPSGCFISHPRSVSEILDQLV